MNYEPQVLQIPVYEQLVLEGDSGTELLEVARQGPPGVPGGAGGSFVLFPASTAIGGHRAVRLLGGQLAYASASNVADANLVIGITVSAASQGGAAGVQTSGTMTEPSWSWTPDAPVFCGEQGALTQVAPSAGFVLIIGVAISATRILVGAKMPLIV